MSNKDRLYAWLQAHRTEVFVQVDADGMTDMRALPILNKAAGLAGTADEVLSSETVESGSRRLLEAFMAVQAA